MLRPKTHAHPAKFMPAFPTRHVITSSVLLDRRMAPGAFFRVRRDPVGRFGIVFTFLQPHFHQATWRRLVVIQGAAKTEKVLAEALDRRDYTTQVTLFDGTVNGILAIRGRTPFQVFLVVHVGPDQ